MAIILLWQQELFVIQAEDAAELSEEHVKEVVEREGEGRPKQVCTSGHSHSTFEVFFI